MKTSLVRTKIIFIEWLSLFIMSDYKILDRLEEKFFKIRWLALWLIFISFLLFKGKIEKYITDKIVINYLSDIKQTYLIDFLFFLFSLFLLIVFINRCTRNYRVNKTHYFILIILSVIYFYYRNVNEIWAFLPLKTFHFYYLDIVFLVLLFQTVILIRNLIPEKPNNISSTVPFILDEPLKNNEIDILNREDDAKYLSQRLIATKSEKAIAIGINGEWGAGKTSFTQLMKNQLEKHSECEIIDFNPWRGYQNNGLYKDFFAELSNSIGKYGDLLRISLKKYGDTLLNVNGSVITETINIANSVFGIDAIEKQHDEINDALKKINKQFFIFIDDLDRLTKEEIVEVLKLIRNTADFYNLKFILSYDKNYLINAIKEINSYNYQNYLEKIVLHEYNIVPIESQQLRKEFSVLLESYCVAELKPEVEKISVKKNFERDHLIGIYMRSLRDVKRFANSFIPRINKYYKEVDIIDYINLEILRIKYPLMFYKIYYDKNKFIENGDYGIHKLINVSNSKERAYIEDYVEQHHEYLQVNLADRDRLIALIKALFNADRIFESTLSDKSIKREKNFQFYFRNENSSNRMSYSEFNEIIKSDFSIIEIKLGELVKQGKRTAIIDKFQSSDLYNNCSTKEEFEKYIKSIYFLANVPKVESDVYAGYPDKDLFDKLSDKDKIIRTYYNNDLNAYKNFIESIFDNAQYPFYMESDFLDYISVNRMTEYFVLSQEQIENYLVKYFSTYTQISNILDTDFWRLYNNCRRGVLDGNTIIKEHLPEAKNYYRNFIFKNETILKSYLTAVVSLNIREDDLFMISVAVKDVFGSYEEFTKLLNESKYKDLDFVKEYISFYEAFYAVEFLKYVKFDFKYLRKKE